MVKTKNLDDEIVDAIFLSIFFFFIFSEVIQGLRTWLHLHHRLLRFIFVLEDEDERSQCHSVLNPLPCALKSNGVLWSMVTVESWFLHVISFHMQLISMTWRNKEDSTLPCDLRASFTCSFLRPGGRTCMRKKVM